MSKKQKTIEELVEEALVPEEEQPYEVPENWVWVRLGSAVNFFSGSAFPNQFQGHKHFNIPFYKVGSLKDIDSDYYIFNEDNTISEEMRIQLKAKIVPKDTILFAKIGEAIRLNRRSIVSKPACIDNNLMGFRGKEKVLENKFLLLWSLKEGFYKYSQATAVPSIRKSTLEEITLPLPPLNEQKRIAEKVERYLSKVEEAEQLIKEAKETFELRRAAVLDKAFRGELTRIWRRINGRDFSWKEVNLEEIIESGPQNGLYKPQSAYGEGNLIVRIDNFYNGKINSWETLKKLRLEQKEIDLYSLKNNDVIINRVNSIEYLGKSALVRNLNQTCVFESNVMRLKLSNKVDPEYIILFLNSNKGLQELRKNAKHAVNQASINQQDVKNVKIPLPTLKEQNEIVRLVSKIMLSEDSSSMQLNMKKKIENIKQSILSQAFRGNLGTNDPTEENAIELLKEVLQEQVN